jgi:hypothetical protein
VAELLRRLLWLVPVLALGSLPLFALLAAGLPPGAEHGSAPLFFNPEPRGAREHALTALEELAKGEAPGAAERLARVGGAALPHVLPQLSEFDAATQRRVALALAPVARRMGVARDAGVLDEPELAFAFWTRFWQDRSLDFQPTVVSRLTRRVTARATTLGSTDLVQLDTYALPELVRQLGEVRSEEDVARARRLLAVIGTITDRRWDLPPDASLARARETVTACRRWWDENRHWHDEVAGLRRVTATIVQTRYGRWALRTLRELTGLDTSRVGDQLRQGLRVSAPLLACCLFGTWLAGSLGAALLLSAESSVRRRLGLVSAAAIPLLLPALVLWPPRAWFGQALGTACWVSVLLGAVPAVHLGRRSVRALEPTGARTDAERQGAKAATRRDTLWVSFARVLHTAPLWAPATFVQSVSLVFALEWTSGLGGLGPRTIAALQNGDAPWLMALCLGLAALTAVAHILADGLQKRALGRATS